MGAGTVNSIRLAIAYRCQEAPAAFNGQANAQQTLECVKMGKKSLSAAIRIGFTAPAILGSSLQNVFFDGEMQRRKPRALQ